MFCWLTDSKGRKVVFFRADPRTPWPRKLGEKSDLLGLANISEWPAPSSYLFGELYSPVLDYIEYTINYYLQGRASPRVAWGEDGASLALSFVPSGLGGAIWLQFAEAIRGNVVYRACETCGGTIEVSGTANRSDRRFCSAACRSKAYRGRKERAREMFAAGKTVPEIAAALEAQMGAVEGWVKNTKRDE